MYYCFKRFRERQYPRMSTHIHRRIHPYRVIILHNSMLGAFLKPWKNYTPPKITPNHLTTWTWQPTCTGLQAFRRILTGPLDVGSPGVPAGTAKCYPFWESTSEPSSKYRIWYNALKAFPPWVLDDMRVLPWDTLMPADLSKAFKLCLLWPFFAAGIVGMSGFPMNLQIHWAHSFFLWRWRYVLKYLCEIHETNRWCLELEIYDSLMKLGFLISIMAHHQY